VKYLRKLYERYYKVQGFDRMLIALASYNVGPRHIRSAQKIAGQRGLDPYRWSSLERTLPLLCYERYINTKESGYCRGTEPVRYVNRILVYFDILRRKALDGLQFSRH
jgi:membrane-bound lytic murein transglycosylase F